MPKKPVGPGRAAKQAKAKPKANLKSTPEAAAKAGAPEKPRRGRRPDNGKIATPPAPVPPPAPAAKRGKGTGAAKPVPKAHSVPANTQGVSLPHTLADVSRVVKVSATTIKYYLTHLPHLIEFAGEGRKRRFSDRAVQMLTDVRRMLAEENKSLSDIRQQLGQTALRKPADEVSVAAPAANASATLEDLTTVLIGEVRAMRSEVERLRRTRWLPSD